MTSVSQQDQLASVEATIGRLPPGVRIRDFQLIAIHVSPTNAQHAVVLFDRDRDLRVLWALAALVLMERAARATLIALSESRGELHAWWPNPIPLLAPVGMRLLQRATDAALAPDDKRTVEKSIIVPTKADGTEDLDALSENDLLRQTAPRSIALGRVQL